MFEMCVVKNVKNDYEEFPLSWLKEHAKEGMWNNYCK